MANRYEVLWFEAENGDSYTVQTNKDGGIMIESDAMGGPLIIIKKADAYELLDYLTTQLLSHG